MPWPVGPGPYCVTLSVTIVRSFRNFNLFIQYRCSRHYPTQYPGEPEPTGIRLRLELDPVDEVGRVDVTAVREEQVEDRVVTRLIKRDADFLHGIAHGQSHLTHVDIELTVDPFRPMITSSFASRLVPSPMP